MAEFKKLSDVEVVAEPIESANVLIEENGVIKKAPKTAVGGAGVSSWNDLTDRPFGIANEIITTGEVILVFSENSCTIPSGELMSYLNKEGQIVYVKYDGIEYTCTGEYDSSRINVIFGDEDYNDYPFYFKLNLMRDGIIFNVEDTSVTNVEIYTIAEITNLLEEKYIPDTIARVSEVGTFIAILEEKSIWNGDDEEIYYICDVNYSDIIKAINNGQRVILNYERSSNVYTYFYCDKTVSYSNNLYMDFVTFSSSNIDNSISVKMIKLIFNQDGSFSSVNFYNKTLS